MRRRGCCRKRVEAGRKSAHEARDGDRIPRSDPERYDWSGARAAESGSLLRSCAPKGYRGFESPLLREWRQRVVDSFTLVKSWGFDPKPSPTGGRKRRQDAAGRGRRRVVGARTMRATKTESPLLRERRQRVADVLFLFDEVVAQLDRASDCGSEGRRFESSQPHVFLERCESG